MFSLIERQCQWYIQQLFRANVDSLEETVFRNCRKTFLFLENLKGALFGETVDIR